KPSSASVAEMADYFFDTSALVKRHVIEAGSPRVKSLVRAKAAHTLDIARITAVEVTSAITRRQHGGHLSPAQGRRDARAFPPPPDPALSRHGTDPCPLCRGDAGGP